DFFTTLSKELGFSDDAIQNVLLTFECYKQEKERFKGSYIFVNTNLSEKMSLSLHLHFRKPRETFLFMI
ncbi:MAG: hypothetical protein QG560_128, partial [Campylobacterota bacterium]|nr:hypothetical protein [Campylobacterota bacterium]